MKSLKAINKDNRDINLTLLANRLEGNSYWLAACDIKIKERFVNL